MLKTLNHYSSNNNYFLKTKKKEIMGRSINIKSIFLIVTVCFLSINVNAQGKDKNKKISIEVKGNCGMCKSRIEKASSQVKGVKYANWDIPSKQLTLILDENKCTPLDIKKAIALVGHDSDTENASDKVYNNLPPCCKFRDPNSLHMDHNNKH
ncbi:MAG: heavy-metal-associated domain-containing protein [Gelidibacter sp.]